MDGMVAAEVGMVWYHTVVGTLEREMIEEIESFVRGARWILWEFGISASKRVSESVV